MSTLPVPQPISREDLQTAPCGLYLLPDERRGDIFDVDSLVKFTNVKQCLLARVMEATPDLPTSEMVTSVTIRPDGKALITDWVVSPEEDPLHRNRW